MLHCLFRVEPGPGAPDLASLEWLSEAERERARALRFEPRRRDWLGGRRAAKEVVAQVMRERWDMAPPPADVVIEAAPGGAPIARLSRGAAAALGFAPGQRLPVAVSISHRAGAVFCAAAADDEVSGTLGADLELLEPRSAAFVADFLRAEEIAACPAIVWSAKEAVLKALGLGLTVDTRTFACVPEDVPARTAGVLVDGDGWRTLRLLGSPPGAPDAHGSRRQAGSVPVTCLWRTRGPFVQTLAFGRPALRAQGAA